MSRWWNLEASTGRDPAPPDQRGTSADLGAGRESVVLRSSSEAHRPLDAAPNKRETRRTWPHPASPLCASFSEELALKTRHRLTLTSPDGSVPPIPFSVLCGAAHSPLALIIAGVHGDEFEGPAAILDAIEDIEPAEVSGSILFVPVANPESFCAGTRRHPDGGDLNRLFPGNREGTASERLASKLFDEFAASSSCILSMHGWSREAEVLPYVEYSVAGGDATRGAAHSLGLPYVEAYDWPCGVLGEALQSRNVPILETEIGGLGMVTPEGQALSKQTIRRFLQSFGLIRTDVVCPAGGMPIEHTDIAAAHCGLFRPSVSLGEQVHAGQVLGSIQGCDGAVREKLTAPTAGVIGILRRFASVRAPDLLFRIFSERRST